MTTTDVPDAIVVMGKRPIPGRPPRELDARAAYAVLVWRARGKSLPLICIEGCDIAGYAQSGAEFVAAIALRAGVPARLLETPALSNCTVREVVGIRDVLNRLGCRRPLVITHAYHVRRTRWYLRQAGLAPEMCACGDKLEDLLAGNADEHLLQEIIRRGTPSRAQLLREHVVEAILSVLHAIGPAGEFECWLADRIRRGGGP